LEQISSFYLDPYSRPSEKRQGAWMNGPVTRTRVQTTKGSDGSTVRLPVTWLVCNQSPPVGNVPSLMSLRDVETLFHEFGHACQHMLTTVNYSSASGIRGVEWDAVELPSQFMENWLYDARTMSQISKHHTTGEPLPADLFAKVCNCKNHWPCITLLT
jgi:oligopeptidase A